MEYVWKSSLWILAYFKELHNDQEYYWPTTMHRAGVAVVSTVSSVIQQQVDSLADDNYLSRKPRKNI